MSTDKEIGSRLAVARKTAGYETAVAAAEALGIKYPTYAGHENGNRGLRTNLERYARRYRVSVDWLLTGRGPGPSGDRMPDPSAQSASIARVPDLAIFAGMGGGGYLEVAVDEHGNPTEPDQVRGYWEMPEYMLRRFGNLRNIYAWEVRGDSMEPTIEGGSVVFVDTGQRSPPPDDIYAVNAGDGLVVKRLHLIPRSDQVEIISDNSRYPPDRLQREQVTVWGRVVGWFQWRG